MHLPENWDQWLFGVVFALFFLGFVFNMFRRGGFKAALFNAKIQETVGEVSATGPKLVSQVLRVHALERNGESLIGIEVVSKTVTSYHMLPIVLTEAQARALGSLLREAGARH
jgi:hypothetical protein